MSNFIERLFGRRIQSSQPSNPELTVQPRTLRSVGVQILSRMDIPEAEKPQLYKSLMQHETHLTGSRRSRFISLQELDYFSRVMTALGIRPVITIDLQTDGHPGDTLESLITIFDTQDTKETDRRKTTPIVFVKGFNQERLEEIDPDGSFDGSLRHQSQHEDWAVFIQGTGSIRGLSGSISGSSEMSNLVYQEQRG